MSSIILPCITALTLHDFILESNMDLLLEALQINMADKAGVYMESPKLFRRGFKFSEWVDEYSLSMICLL